MQDKLRSCPFCGTSAQIYETKPDELGSIRYGVSCPNSKCHIYYQNGIKLYGTMQTAIRNWNVREKSYIPYAETRRIKESEYMATIDGKILDPNGLLVKEVMGQSGYPVVEIKVDGRTTNMAVKYMIAQTFLAKPKNAKYVINLNGDVWNNHVNNLMWCTGSEYGAILDEQRMEELEEHQRRLDEEQRQREMEREFENQLDQIMEEYGLLY